jgi:DNA-binding NtrC family response regulator
MKSPGVLFISPNSEDAARLSQILNGMPFPLTHVRDLAQARATLTRKQYDVILTEAALNDGGWLDVLHMARQCSPDSEVIVTDPFADSRFWAEALNMGAYDLVAQPFYDAEVRRILGNACSRMAPPARMAAAASTLSTN